jgi:hypothetical protein
MCMTGRGEPEAPRVRAKRAESEDLATATAYPVPTKDPTQRETRLDQLTLSLSAYRCQRTEG